MYENLTKSTHFLNDKLKKKTKKEEARKTQIKIEPCRYDQLLKIQPFQGKKLKPRTVVLKFFPLPLRCTEKPRFRIDKKKRESKELKRRKKELETEMGLVLIFETDFETAKK